MTEKDPLGGAAVALGLDRRGGTARGRVDGRFIEIETPVVPVPGSVAPVVLTGRVEPALDLGLWVSAPRAAGPPPGRQAIRLRTGIALLDEGLAVAGDEEERVGALLLPIVGELAVCFDPEGATEVVLTDASVRCSRDGAAAEMLASSARAIAALLGAIDHSRASVPVAVDLRAHAVAWRELASQRNLESTDTPLRLWGRIDGVEVSAEAVRVSRGRHRIDVVARLVEPLRVALSVRPRGLLDGEGLTLGDSALDGSFVAAAADRAALGKLLDPDVRRRLLDLRDLAPEIADDGVTLRTRGLPSEPRQVAVLLSAAHALVQRLRENARALRAARVGPYR